MDATCFVFDGDAESGISFIAECVGRKMCWYAALALFTTSALEPRIVQILFVVAEWLVVR